MQNNEFLQKNSRTPNADTDAYATQKRHNCAMTAFQILKAHLP